MSYGFTNCGRPEEYCSVYHSLVSGQTLGDIAI